MVTKHILPKCQQILTKGFASVFFLAMLDFNLLVDIQLL